MYTVEDFRHAPMRVLAAANTREEARAMADAMGPGEHAFISEHGAHNLDGMVRLADEHPMLALDLAWATQELNDVKGDLRAAEQNAGGFESDLCAEEFAHADTKRERDRLLALLTRHGIDPNAKAEAA